MLLFGAMYLLHLAHAQFAYTINSRSVVYFVHLLLKFRDFCIMFELGLQGWGRISTPPPSSCDISPVS